MGVAVVGVAVGTWGEFGSALLTMTNGTRLEQLPSKLHPLLSVTDLTIGNEPVHKFISNKTPLVCCQMVLSIGQEPGHIP